MITYILLALTIVVSVAGFRDHNLFNRLSMSPYRVSHNNEWYRIFTHGFLHGGYAHLAVNMLVLWSFGLAVESDMKALQMVGLTRSSALDYILLYFGALAASSAFDMAKFRNNPHYVSVGASGAVSAVIFASIFFNPWSDLYLMAVIPIPGIVFGVLYLAYSQYMSRRAERGDNINHKAHLYGAIFGFVFPLLIDPSLFNTFITNFLAKFR